MFSSKLSVSECVCVLCGESSLSLQLVVCVGNTMIPLFLHSGSLSFQTFPGRGETDES